MKPRSFRSAVLAAAAAAAGLVIVSTTGSPAGAATVSQTLGCGIGGNQTVNLTTTAPATVVQGGTFDVVLAGTGSVSPPAEIKNMVTTFQAPTGSSIVAGSAVASGGSGTLGSVTTTISGSTVAIKVPGPIKSGASFTPPTLAFKLQATGAAGTVLKTTIRQSAGYTLTAAGSFNVSCDANTPLTTLTSTTIQAAATTTSTTTTTAPTTTTTTKPGATTTSTTTTAPTTTTTTAPPTVSTSVWSPTGDCGSLQTTVAPANTKSVQITAVGGTGGRSGSQASSSTVAGGTGGQVASTFAATAGQTYSAIVACNGVDGGRFANTATPGGYSAGGGTGRGTIIAGQAGASGGSGGGSSAACLGTPCAPGSGNQLVVAGGGGGGGVSNCAGTSSGAGGAGGNASSTSDASGAGNSGTNGSSASSSGGAGGVNSNGGSAAGGSNGNGSGGAGVNVVGGAGGGGYVGGSAGSNTSTGCKGAGGGGGGSSWVRSNGTSTSFGTAGTPAVTLTFTIETPAPTTTTTSTTTTQPTTTTTTAVPCTADKAPFPTVQALVTQQYQDFTGAAPTTAQNNQWVPAITNCSATADALIVSLLPTDQARDDARLVRLYLAYFKRPPDPDGFAYWQRQLDAGRGLINAAKKFSESPEFKRTYGTLSNSDFIELVYQNVLGRPSDPTGKAFWLTRLDNKTKNRGDVMINFSESSENTRNKVNHVQVFRLYRGMMQKFPSKTTYFALLNPILDNGKTLEDAAKAERLSAEYDARV